MGLCYAMFSLDNPKNSKLRPIEVEALADTESTFLCIPLHIAHQLELEPTSEKEITTADGQRRMCPYVGPVHLRFENRECYVGAIVLGDQVLLGAVPMEDMDLVVLPRSRKVAVNPLNPNFAAGLAK